MSAIIFKAKLLNVETGVNDKGQLTMKLVFASQRFDRGLEQMVPCSQNVKVIEDHHHMKDFYMSYKTTGDGKPLQITEQKPLDSKA